MRKIAKPACKIIGNPVLFGDRFVVLLQHFSIPCILLYDRNHRLTGPTPRLCSIQTMTSCRVEKGIPVLYCISCLEFGVVVVSSSHPTGFIYPFLWSSISDVARPLILDNNHWTPARHGLSPSTTERVHG